MVRKVCMGNEAIALGALAAGLRLAAGYPGTPSTEIIETLVRERREGVDVQWSVNEKAALEVAAGGAYAGARTMCTMKQVGLNVASDPLMSLAYIGVKGGMVVADGAGHAQLCEAREPSGLRPVVARRSLRNDRDGLRLLRKI